MTPRDLKIEHVAVADLVPYARNPRTHSDEQVEVIAASIERFGWTNPVLIGNDSDIIAGHGRLMAAKRLGLKVVPVLRIGDLSPDERRAYVIADNQTALRAGWDLDILRLELTELKGMDFDLGPLGFDDAELAAVLDMRPTGLIDPDAVPEPPANPVATRGDLWALGRHRLLCGDSMVADDVAKVLDKAGNVAVVSDPPYGMKWDGKVSVGPNGHRGRPKTRHYGKTIEGDDKPFDPSPWLAFPHVILWGSNHYGNKLPIGTTLIWIKRLDSGFGSYLSDAEVAWLNRGHGVYCRRDTSILGETRTRQHSNQKPVAIMEWCLGFVEKAQIILDPFVGSGTTIIAAEMIGRACYALEIDPAYVDVAIIRWQSFTGERATLNGKTFEQVKSERHAV